MRNETAGTTIKIPIWACLGIVRQNQARMLDILRNLTVDYLEDPIHIGPRKIWGTTNKYYLIVIMMRRANSGKYS